MGGTYLFEVAKEASGDTALATPLLQGWATYAFPLDGNLAFGIGPYVTSTSRFAYVGAVLNSSLVIASGLVFRLVPKHPREDWTWRLSVAALALGSPGAELSLLVKHPFANGFFIAVDPELRWLSAERLYGGTLELGYSLH